LFIVNNGSFAIVEQGLRHIIPDTGNYHATLTPVDHLSVAKAFGWDGLRVEPDLSNLREVMDRCHSTDDRSLLIEVPVDPAQEIGSNPRIRHLAGGSYL
jgi:acetolactate synthase I/II/III large subunit